MTQFWHVTSNGNASAILAEGFKGDWGDDGFGVYLFDSFDAACDYAHEGGWDGSLQEGDIAILEIIDEAAEIYPVEVHPEWPNPEDYEHVFVYPMEDNEGSVWKPQHLKVVEQAHLTTRPAPFS